MQSNMKALKDYSSVIREEIKEAIKLEEERRAAIVKNL
jgi:hypothetical protein